MIVPKNVSIIPILDQIQCTRWLCIKSACQSFQISPHFCPPIPPIRFETSSLPHLSPRPSAAKGTMSFQGDDSHPCFQWKQICAVVTATSTNPPRGTESWVYTLISCDVNAHFSACDTSSISLYSTFLYICVCDWKGIWRFIWYDHVCIIIISIKIKIYISRRLLLTEKVQQVFLPSNGISNHWNLRTPRSLYKGQRITVFVTRSYKSLHSLTHPSFPKKPIKIYSCTFWKDSHTLPCAKASVPELSGIRLSDHKIEPKLHLESRWLNFYNLLPHGDVAFALLKEAAMCFLPLSATTWVQMDMFTC